MFPELAMLTWTGFQIRYDYTNQQIADIQSEGSFSRERWSRLTLLFHQMTPHLHTNNHLVLTVVEEMCFFFIFGTATNVWFDGLRGIPLRAGVPCS